MTRPPVRVVLEAALVFTIGVVAGLFIMEQRLADPECPPMANAAIIAAVHECQAAGLAARSLVRMRCTNVIASIQCEPKDAGR